MGENRPMLNNDQQVIIFKWFELCTYCLFVGAGK